MRIAVLASTWWPDVSGASLSLRDRVIWFRAAGDEVRVYAPLVVPSSQVPTDWAIGIHPVEAAWSFGAEEGNVRPTRSGVSVAAKAIGAWSPDVIWIESPDKIGAVAFGVLAGLPTGIPVVGFVHADLPRAAWEEGHAGLGAWLRLAGGGGFRVCDWLVVPVASAVSVVPVRYRTKTRVFQHLTAPVNRVRPRRPGGPQVVWIGRATAEKGWPELVRVVRALAGCGVRFTAYVPRDPGGARKLPRELELRVGYPRGVILESLFGGDVYLSTSRRETFSLAALEAMLAGLLPVLPALATLRDWVGDHGWYYSPSRFREATCQVLAAIGESSYRVSESIRAHASTVNGSGLEILREWMKGLRSTGDGGFKP